MPSAQSIENTKEEEDNAIDSRRRSPYSLLYDSIKEECVKLGIWCEELARDLPKRWERHGDMALLPENSFTSRKWHMFGGSAWKIVASSLKVKRIGRKKRICDDQYRTPHIELLYGVDGWVEHVDNKIRYQYDVTKCMFSIGNIGEKLRVAGFDCRNEVVVDLFAGIGYFTLPYLVHAHAQRLYACEWNPDAADALRRNVHINKVEDRCTILEGDCRAVSPQGVADRVNLGLLPTARQYLLVACKTLKPKSGGVFHIHENVTSSRAPLKKRQSTVDSAYCEEFSGYPFASDVVLKKVSVGDKPSGPVPTRKRVVKSASPDDGSVEVEEVSANQLRKELSDDSAHYEEGYEGSDALSTSVSGGAPSDDQPDGSEVDEDTETKQDKDDENEEQEEDEPSSEISKARKLSTRILMEYERERSRELYTLAIDKEFADHWERLDPNWRSWASKCGQQMLKYLNHMHDGEWTGRVLRVGKIKSYAPRIDHLVLDLECRPARLMVLCQSLDSFRTDDNDD